jgi:hypothetical protein
MTRYDDEQKKHPKKPNKTKKLISLKNGKNLFLLTQIFSLSSLGDWSGT